MAQISQDTEKKIHTLQVLEQALQNIMMQRQAFQLELNETENASEEIKKASGDVYRMVGQVMLKADKMGIEKELSQKKDILSLRLKSLEAQEKKMRQEAESLQKEVLKEIK